jgi:hypothetical protein
MVASINKAETRNATVAAACVFAVNFANVNEPQCTHLLDGLGVRLAAAAAIEVGHEGLVLLIDDLRLYGALDLGEDDPGPTLLTIVR